MVFQNRFGLLRKISGNVVEKKDRLAFWESAVNSLSTARYYHGWDVTFIDFKDYEIDYEQPLFLQF